MSEFYFRIWGKSLAFTLNKKSANISSKLVRCLIRNTFEILICCLSVVLESGWHSGWPHPFSLPLLYKPSLFFLSQFINSWLYILLDLLFLSLTGRWFLLTRNVYLINWFIFNCIKESILQIQYWSVTFCLFHRLGAHGPGFIYQYLVSAF